MQQKSHLGGGLTEYLYSFTLLVERDRRKTSRLFLVIPHICRLLGILVSESTNMYVCH
jgi:hypothetical protein